MKRGYWLCLWKLSAGLLLLTAIPATAALTRDQVAYWRQHYGEAPREERCVQKTHTIFNRVARAAGVRPENVPRLLITQHDPQWSLLAMALPDQWIVLSKGVPERLLGRCDQASALGEARLAFILGHELAHQLRRQFWHYRLFHAPKNPEQASPQLESEEVRRIQELQADNDGIVYAAMAGYTTQAVVTDDRSSSFFEEWIRSHSGTHPTLKQRTEIVRARLRRILAQVDVFEMGMHFYQVGKYDAAIRAFKLFRRDFDSHEVNHNLAVSHHQLGLQIYCRWKRTPLIPFHLSLMVEPLTLATRIRLDRQYFSRGGGPTGRERATTSRQGHCLL